MNKNTVVSNVIWRFAEKILIQAVNSIVTIIVARILDPSHYGLVTISASIISLISIFVDNGIVDALIQKKEVDDIDYSTVLISNIIFSAILYLILFVSAPYIAKFYGEETIRPLIRVLSIRILITSIHNVQSAYVARNMVFKTFFFASLIGTVVAAVVGIYMATNGYGVWALVAIELVDGVIDTIVVSIILKWMPGFKFSFSRFKEMFDYGWKILAIGIEEVVYSKLYQLIIGKVYTTADLAYYDKGDNIPRKMVYNLNHSIFSVVKPVLVQKQDNVNEFVAIMKKTLKTTTYIIAPILIGMIAVRVPFIKVVFTDKWLLAAPYITIMCILYLFRPLENMNFNALKALGKADKILRNQTIEKIIGIAILIFTIKYGVFVMALGVLIDSFINQAIDAHQCKKILNYGYFDQLKDLSGILLLNAAMFGFVTLIGTISGISSDFVLLSVQILSGILFYIIVSLLFKFDEFYYALNLIKKYTKKLKIRKGD